jgi:hypothetical protein
MSSTTPPKVSTKAKKPEVMNTGIKMSGRTVYFTKGLKNPLSGFFFKTEDGKKNKVLVKNVTNEKTKSAFQNILKKHSNTVAPPAGKVLNPLTGRFVKAPGEKKPTTFQDPISLGSVRYADGIELNKQWYSKESLRKMVDTGNVRVPHSRRNLTNSEINTIFTNKKGKKIARKVVNSNNNNSNNNNNNIALARWEEMEGRNMDHEEQIDTLEKFKQFIRDGYYQFSDEGVEFVNFTAYITELPNVIIQFVIHSYYDDREILMELTDFEVTVDGRTIDIPNERELMKVLEKIARNKTKNNNNSNKRPSPRSPSPRRN